MNASGRHFALAAMTNWVLTPRDLKVLQQMTQGLADAEIAEKLGISPRTVHAHLHSNNTKLDVHSRAVAVRVAFLHGLQ